MEKVIVRLEQNPHQYDIRIGHDLLAESGDWVKDCLSSKTKKIAIVSNAKVFRLYGEIARKSLEKSGFEVQIFLMGDGERYKNFHVFENVLSFCSEINLKRTDAILALGGGVVGDLAGFAAAAYLRGVAFLQIPTTLLSMIDSSVGGKTAVNTRFGKNLIGAFHQPQGVLIDVETIKTLARREITAGFCEAVKQGAIAHRKLFDQTADFLRDYPVNSFRNYFSNVSFTEDLQKLLAAQVAFKAEIVAQDELEDPNRLDSRSRKILNFGHTVAHALEKVTDYKRFKHGEAVGYGILVAADIAKTVANYGQNELKSLNDVVKLTGKLPSTENIAIGEVIKAFAFDKKQTNDSLQWVLLKAIGKPLIIQSRDVPDSVIKKSIEKILKK